VSPMTQQVVVVGDQGVTGGVGQCGTCDHPGLG
jgi:hypothetical protein